MEMRFSMVVKQPSWKKATVEARRAFMDHMSGREFGEEQTLQCFYDFIAGWRAFVTSTIERGKNETKV
jgi:hypothetical protein